MTIYAEFQEFLHSTRLPIIELELLDGDYLIININVDKEIIPFEERIKRTSLELDSISNFDIREKRMKLDELENYLIQYEYNKRQVPVFSYYEKVLNVLGIRKVEIVSEKSEFDVPKLVINAY